MTILEFNRARKFGNTVIANMTVRPGKATSMSVYASDSSTNPIFRAKLNSGRRLSSSAFRISAGQPVFKFYEDDSGGAGEPSAKIRVQFSSGRAIQIGNKMGNVAVR